MSKEIQLHLITMQNGIRVNLGHFAGEIVETAEGEVLENVTTTLPPNAMAVFGQLIKAMNNTYKATAEDLGDRETQEGNHSLSTLPTVHK